jgi:TonB family protein
MQTPPTGEYRACRQNYYPSERLPADFKGITSLTFHIEPDGGVKDVAVTKSSGIDGLDQAAANCVAQWHYNPAMRNG